MTSRQILDVQAAIKFIYKEIVRLLEFEQEDFLETNGLQFLVTIPDPRHIGGILACGFEARNKIDEISEKALKMHGLLGRVSTHELREVTGLAVSTAIFVRTDETLDKQISNLLTTIGKSAKALCKDTKFFFPCHLMTAKHPDCFNIGPVRFLNRQAFRKMVMLKIKAEFANLDKSANDFERNLIADAIRYYRKFQWVAEIEVKQASDKISLQIAQSLASAALDCLHLMFGGQFSRHMRMGMDAPGKGRSAQLRIASNAKLLGSFTYGGQGHSNFGGDWFDQFAINTAAGQELVVHSKLISLLQSGIEERPVAQRFLDASHWFGEAVRESRESSRIIKIVTGLERLLIAKKPKEGMVIETFTKRLSVICRVVFPETSEDVFFDRAKKVYNLRSELVHGSQLPRDEKIKTEAFDCEQLAEQTLKGALLFFNYVGMFDKNVKMQEFEDYMDDLVKRGDDIVASLQSQKNPNSK